MGCTPGAGGPPGGSFLCRQPTSIRGGMGGELEGGEAGGGELCVVRPLGNDSGRCVTPSLSFHLQDSFAPGILIPVLLQRSHVPWSQAVKLGVAGIWPWWEGLQKEPEACVSPGEVRDGSALHPK